MEIQTLGEVHSTHASGEPLGNMLLVRSCNATRKFVIAELLLNLHFLTLVLARNSRQEGVERLQMLKVVTVLLVAQ